MLKNNVPFLVVSDMNGTIFEIPEYFMVGASADTYSVPTEHELIRLPHGSDLFSLPGSVPVGYDPHTNMYVQLETYHGIQIQAVAAFMAPAYVQLLTTAYAVRPKAGRLPLYSYTAVGWHRGAFYACGARIDADTRQDLKNFDVDVIKQKALQVLDVFPHNRLVRHVIENCVFRYGCPAARNFAMGRWECPLPTSHTCNAACLGCISLQPKSSKITASHQRLCFVPTPEEIAELAVFHLQRATKPVVSFGQGCEGEPLMVGDTIEKAIELIRSKTSKGVINLNTNASKPALIERLCVAGLDSVRVSMNSAQASLYEMYYRPKGYSFADVIKSLKVLRNYDKWSMINYFIFPGLSDNPEEMKALYALIKATKINMIQTRNLNIDPHWYCQELGLYTLSKKPVGMIAWIEQVRKTFPSLSLGYFNPYIPVKKQNVGRKPIT